MSRMSVIAALVTVALALMATSAAARNSDSTFVYEEPISFTFPAGVCPDLPGDLSIEFTGTLRGHLHVSTDANGVFHVNWPDVVTGTAVDSAGGTYVFNYHNVLSVRDAGLPVDLTVTDHFNLVGNGAANRLHTFFVLKLRITEAGVGEVVFNAHGDPEHCDPL